MKLKFPKKIQILSFEFKVVYNKKEWGAYLDFDKREIGIGTASLAVGDQSTVFDNICHEIMEAVCNITNTCHLDRGTTWDYKFVMNHKEFQNNISIFSSVIQKFIE